MPHLSLAGFAEKALAAREDFRRAWLGDSLIPLAEVFGTSERAWAMLFGDAGRRPTGVIAISVSSGLRIGVAMSHGAPPSLVQETRYEAVRADRYSQAARSRLD